MKPEFDPDEKPAFGQVWRWMDTATITLIAPCQVHLGENDHWQAIWTDDYAQGTVDDWAGLYTDRRPMEGWERLA